MNETGARMRMRLLGSMAALVCGLAATAHAAAPDNVLADARVILDKIVSIPSSAGLGQVPAVAMYLADRFRAAGFPEDDIHILPSGETASLVVRVRVQSVVLYGVVVAKLLLQNHKIGLRK